VLACGTRGGRMVQWRSSTLSGVPKSESNWSLGKKATFTIKKW
jgi:hypothetical protein